MSVVVARFEDLVARGLRSYLDDDPELDVRADRVRHDNLDDALRAHEPQVAVVNLGSLASPVELHELARRHPDTRFVVLAARPSPRECNQMLAFGATACLPKDTAARDIVVAVRLASRGLHVIPRSTGEPTPEPLGPEALTAREADVLERLQAGRSNAEIALDLHIGVETVRTHARNIYRKLGVRSRRQLAPLRKP